jgi:hypothetical protein
MANDQIAEDALNAALVTGLSALGWIITEPTRADRMLALTGLSPADLRAGIERPDLLAALLNYLEAHEPDLIACADALTIDPSALIRARMILEAQSA